MSLIDTTKEIQKIVGVNEDGQFGPLTALAVLRALEMSVDDQIRQSHRLAVLKAQQISNSAPAPPDDGWCFTAEIDGEDIIVSNTTATWFGGDHDPQDNGETASGINTKGNPGLMGCALPVLPQVHSTSGSPLPHLPWGTVVRVTHWLKSIDLPLIDNGPAKSARHGIDLTVAAFKAFGSDLSAGFMQVEYRVLGGARFVA